MTFLLLCGCGRVGYEVTFPDASTPDAIAADDSAIDASVDSAVADATMEAGPPDPTACDDAHAGATFCSGLELSSLSDWDGTTLQGGGVSEWASSPTYRGGGAYHARIAAGGARGEVTKTLPAFSAGPMHMRFYMRAHSDTPITQEIVAASVVPTGSPSYGLTLRLLPSSMIVMVRSNFAGIVSNDVVLSSAFPKDAWVCVELALDIAATGSVSLSLDGNTVLTRANIETRVTSGYDRWTIGVGYSDPAETGADLTYDEVVIDDVLIGCD